MGLVGGVPLLYLHHLLHTKMRFMPSASRLPQPKRCRATPANLNLEVPHTAGLTSLAPHLPCTSH